MFDVDDVPTISPGEIDSFGGKVLRVYGPGIHCYHFGGYLGDTDPYTGSREASGSMTWIPWFVVAQHGRQRFMLHAPLSMPDDSRSFEKVLTNRNEIFAGRSTRNRVTYTFVPDDPEDRTVH